MKIRNLEVYPTYQDFPNRVDLWGDKLGKMAKNCMKITRLTFWGKTMGGDMGGQANFLGSWGDFPSSHH